MFRASVIAAALASAACGDARLEELEAIRAEVCACKTVACGEAAVKRVPQDEIKGHRAQKIARAMVDCLHKLWLTDRPSTDPDAEAPAEGAAASGGADPAARRP
jgi:hypothetical protein